MIMLITENEHPDFALFVLKEKIVALFIVVSILHQIEY